jgi:sulfur carrier protein ThiS
LTGLVSFGKMVEKFTGRGFMRIQLTDSDLAKMPPTLYKNLLRWLHPDLETIAVGESNPLVPKASREHIRSNTDSREERGNTHVLLSQLLDAGITRSGMPVRVRLKRASAKAVGRDYLNGLTISPKGTVIREGEEFDKPSPLATKLNGSPVNGWEYIEIKKDNEWVRLDALRQQVR